jgi:hypothetical protein
MIDDRSLGCDADDDLVRIEFSMLHGAGGDAITNVEVELAIHNPAIFVRLCSLRLYRWLNPHGSPVHVACGSPHGQPPPIALLRSVAILDKAAHSHVLQRAPGHPSSTLGNRLTVSALQQHESQSSESRNVTYLASDPPCSCGMLGEIWVLV